MKGSYFYIAKVTDNQDEEGLNRIKITTQFTEETVSMWVPYLSAAAGNGMGFSSIPDIDDQVLVLSMGDGREHQIVIGSFWNENSNPPKTEENSDADLNGDGNNSLNFVKSKAGNMIILDDTEEKEKIQIIASGGSSRIEIDNENEVINLETDKDIGFSAKGAISIQADEEITLSAKKAFNIESEDFCVKASKEVNFEASKDMTLKGSGIALN
jgi:uncharacterized protein involved in type VI secretion and phage assembly